MKPRRPTAAELAAAADRTVPDLLAPGLTIVFCGINPSLYSAAVGLHFARPGNRFWKALHAGGFTERVLAPWEGEDLLSCGVGITNVVARATARADQLEGEELVAGAAELAARLEPAPPRVLAMLGIGAFRTAWSRPAAGLGPQPERFAGAAVWVLPNPSGLNAHYQVPALGEWFARLRAATAAPDATLPGSRPPR